MRVSVLLPLVLLTACGGAREPAPKRAPQGPSDFQKQVRALPERTRNIALIRAVRDADIDCQGVRSSRLHQTTADGEDLYIADCVDGASYGVLMGREGTAKVLRRGA